MEFGFAILVALVVCLFPSGTYQVIIVLKSEKSHGIGARNTSALPSLTQNRYPHLIINPFPLYFGTGLLKRHLYCNLLSKPG